MQTMTTPKELTNSLEDLENLLNNAKNPMILIKVINEYQRTKTLTDKTLKLLHKELKAIHQKSLERVS